MFVLFCFVFREIAFLFLFLLIILWILYSGKNMGFIFFMEIKGEEIFDEKMVEADEVRKLSK